MHRGKSNVIILITICVLVGPVCVWICWSILGGLISTPSPNDRTLKAINANSRAIGVFYNTNGVLPASLQDVAASEPPFDYWRRAIVYSKSSRGTYELRSFGKDGVRSLDDIAREFDADDTTTASARRINN